MLQQSTVDTTVLFGGREHVLYWQNGGGALAKSPCARVQGLAAWKKNGIAVAQMHSLPVTLYTGQPFDNNTAVIVPRDPAHLPAIWVYCSSPEYHDAVRSIDQALKVTNATLVKIPFDLERWQKVAEEKYPHGLPEPYSEDPTQWIFKGTITASIDPLQVAVARLLGYRWPEQAPEELDRFTDSDGIVCIPSVRAEDPAAERLRELLTSAYGDKWSPAKEAELIAATGSKTRDLDDWLHNDFFQQHCQRFHHRPFIWHIWDGRKRDGFHALVNYHKLAEGDGRRRKRLETLTYAYLGDWIARQKDGVKHGVAGAEDRLVAATELQKRLVSILEGAPPYDIFVRWKSLAEQSIGWEPDINDGMRLNIRPFMATDIASGTKGAGILRCKPNIHWNKDKGKDRSSAPWFWKFQGDRINDHHLTAEEKHTARTEHVPVPQASGAKS